MLDRRVAQSLRDPVIEVLVQWANLAVEDTTWEFECMVLQTYG